ncbi:ly6/PLAUR domain-containing protein 6B [Scleropages formosus]|uniref:LY6/PLAUR domain containing 6B n=1 Tax=Scleropages formosus TaxID=113540 RepID=A0A8C9T2J6_SCLFO|nr:ly6/PLAUR domain-containing protein 6B [Scleropages formosus]XP_029112742.1 ly6/PLAUR domain-containing protein 6B [Scleropages formosus]XP_029112743.1 ly6/PLAUR domain-containing protein 6B [Scleropages formosus]XP_029112744.1 ly6/PLAUR domain-containing protein 6B [Scleropages formosus]
MAPPTALRRIAVLQLLLLSSISDGGDAENINFYDVRPPVGATPFPRSFKCFTCEHASDNYSCNRWAEDKWCPRDTDLCLTMHRFSPHGKSRSVTKRCATLEDCRAVGCRHRGSLGHTECVSCCEGLVCNVDVPTNRSNAVLALRHARGSSECPAHTPCVPSVLAVTLAALALW